MKARRVQHWGKLVTSRGEADDIGERLGEKKRDSEERSEVVCQVSLSLENHDQKLPSGWKGIPTGIPERNNCI